MVSSNLGDNDKMVHNVLDLDEREWLADKESRKGQGFVLRTRGCKRTITGIRIHNAAQPNAIKGFRVSGALEYKGQWENLLETDLEENSDSATFHLSQTIELRFIKFEVLSSHSEGGEGLHSFSLTTGHN